MKKRIIVICLVVGLAVVAIFAALALNHLYHDVLGSPNCVIAEDYSHLTFFGERYVPLVLDGIECKVAECLIKEAQIANTSFLGKLFFREKIYAVSEGTNNEILCLQSEYDFLVSDFYCLESQVDTYTTIAQTYAYDQLTAEIITKDWNMIDLQLSDKLSEMIENRYFINSDSSETCDWSRGDGDESICIYAAQSEGPFRRAEGELIRKQGEYYWFDYDDIPSQHNNADFSNMHAHQIPDGYDEDLDQLFSYMFQ